MTSTKTPAGVGLLGLGYAVPPHLRTNDDPIFGQVRASVPGTVSESDLFYGFKERRYLGPGEATEDLMVSAGRRALDAAAIAPSQIDRLYGYSTVSEYVTPNGLFKVHHGLGLPARTLVLPLNIEFSTFITGALLAWEAIAAGHARYAMINCGSGWTRSADYTAAHSLGMGDAAGAAIVGPSDRLTMVDYAVETASEEDNYHGLTMKTRVTEFRGLRYVAVDERQLPVPLFQISTVGIGSFLTHGMKAPARIALELLERNGVEPDRVTLVTHQASKLLMDAWANHIRPKARVDTLEQYGNMTVANIPVTLAARIHDIETDYVLLIVPGLGSHAAALLLRR
jgi:3-oxoacyl-[acyl-carrier-protein] synthase-3